LENNIENFLKEKGIKLLDSEPNSIDSEEIKSKGAFIKEYTLTSFWII
jgi:hypothetical protein